MDDSNIVIQPQETEGSVTINIPLDGTTVVISDNLQEPEAPQNNQENETPGVMESVEPIDTQPNREAPVTDGERIEPEIKPKHPGGRPCEYCLHKEQIIAKTAEYIQSGINGDKPRMLYLNELAIKLGQHRETILNWSHKKILDEMGNPTDELEHPEFLDMIKSVEEIQELRLQQRVLGRYNPTGAIFLLKTKHGYMETEKQVLAGDKNEPLEIKIVEDRSKEGHAE